MFRHQGKRRTFKNNLRIAIVLSFVAGIVNLAGFLAIHQLTTNVTGHFALFINDILEFEYWKGLAYFLYTVSFLFGSFTSSLLIEWAMKTKKLNIFILPTLLESAILLLVVLFNDLSVLESPNTIACLLLFAMGVQNSFVTKISNAVVRTTHLTGLFTDLGIELSQLLFLKKTVKRKGVVSTIKLRIYIITFFFLGGIFGGFLYMEIHLNVLIIAALILLTGLIYDDMRHRFLLAKRKYLHKKMA
ncbi:YoaK family protein [Roseivirga sp.]|uniref:YoaK family protein n=1 Tax=Roseivirga sp. TaxID=1964215 RepID=UPI002B26F9AC|nr:YoaK family protein [Roseivirga sp.]